MKITFEPGYSAKKRAELEDNNLLQPQHALSTEYLLQWIEKIEPLEGKDIEPEQLITIIFDQMLNFYEIIRNFETRLSQ